MGLLAMPGPSPRCPALAPASGVAHVVGLEPMSEGQQVPRKPPGPQLSRTRVPGVNLRVGAPLPGRAIHVEILPAMGEAKERRRQVAESNGEHVVETAKVVLTVLLGDLLDELPLIVLDPRLAHRLSTDTPRSPNLELFLMRLQ